MSNKNNNSSSSNDLHRVPFYRRPPFLIAGAIILVVIVIILIILIVILSRKPEADNPQETPSTSFDQPNKPATSDDSNDSDSDSDQPDEPEGVLQYEGKDPNKLDELTGSIAYRGVDQGAGILTVTASIDQYLQSAGECKLRLTSNGRELYSETLPATADVTTSVCGPFEAPLSELGSGTINIEITITADNKSGTITDEVQI